MNFELITSSLISNKVADELLRKSISLEKDAMLIKETSYLSSKKFFSFLFEKNILFENKKIFLGKIMKSISPFVRRGTTAFFAYNLKNQIEAYQNGDESVQLDMIFNGLIVSIDGIEAGIESMEFLNLLAGVSEFTGPIGDGLAILLWLGSDSYAAVEQVKKIDQLVDISITEKMVQFLRAMIYLPPSEYLQIKASNQGQLKNSIQFLKENTRFKWYIFPIFESPSKLYQNSHVLLNETNSFINEDESLPAEPNEGRLFCLPGERTYKVLTTIEPLKKSICQNALGIEYSINRESNETIISLGKGNDTAISFPNSFTLFIVNDGHKIYLGSDVGTIFLLQGSSISGLLQGGKGSDIILLNNYYPKETDYLLVEREKSVCGKKINDINFIDVCPSDSLKIKNINQIYGRKSEADRIILGYDSEISFVDGLGGKNKIYKDEIIVPKNTDKKQIFVLRDYSIFSFYLKNTTNDIDYIIPINETGGVKIEIYFSELISIQHQFFSEYTLEHIDSINVEGNLIDISIIAISNFSLSSSNDLDTGKFTISMLTTNNPNYLIESFKNNTYRLENCSYFFNGIELKILNKHQLYIKEILHNNQTIAQKINFFKQISENLDMGISIQLLDNKVIFIGNKQSEALYTTGILKSYFVMGINNEDVYTIVPEKEVVFPLAQIEVYPFILKSYLANQVHTLDLRFIIKMFKHLNPNSNVFCDIVEIEKDLILSLKNTVNNQNLVSIKINNALLYNWYEKLDIYLDSNFPENIINISNTWMLKEAPLIFTPDKKIIIFTCDDIYKNSEIVFLGTIGYFIFYRDHNNLILTQKDGFVKDIDCFTICFKDLYDILEMRTKLLSITFKFFDREIYFQNYQAQIDQAISFYNYLFEHNITKLNISNDEATSMYEEIDLDIKRENYQKIHTQNVQEKTEKIKTIQEPYLNKKNRSENLGTWSIGLISAGAGICFGYLTWIFKRRYGLNFQVNNSPSVKLETTLPLLSISTAQATDIRMNDINKNKVQYLNKLIPFPVDFANEKKDNKFLKESIVDNSILTTLFACDIIIRKFKNKKYNFGNKFFSFPGYNEEKILSYLFQHDRAQKFYNENYVTKNEGVDYKLL